MTALLFAPLPGNESVAEGLARALDAEVTQIETRRFPDGETYLRFSGAVEGCDVALVCTLDRPDGKFLQVVFAASTARQLGARRVGLVCPYLAYMRQDKRFRPGEAVTSEVFARLLSAEIAWLVTVDPHLHRHGALSEIYSVPTLAVQAAPRLAQWIRGEVEKPLIIGPDSESKQWVSAVAESAGAPHIVLRKVRRGDREVEVSVPEAERWRDRTAVLVDDIVSTGRTMVAAVEHLTAAGMAPPVCLAIHAVCAEGSAEALRAAGAARLVTTNTIRHESNRIDLTPEVASAVDELAHSQEGRKRK